MNKKGKNRLMNILYSISALIVLIGAALKLMHNRSDYLFLLIGFVSAFILIAIGIIRYRKSTGNQRNSKNDQMDETL
jgi:mannose/fructose/N-acetylgalactosamine-specific phosphotransferase system component IIC